VLHLQQALTLVLSPLQHKQQQQEPAQEVSVATLQALQKATVATPLGALVNSQMQHGQQQQELAQEVSVHRATVATSGEFSPWAQRFEKYSAHCCKARRSGTVAA